MSHVSNVVAARKRARAGKEDVPPAILMTSWAEKTWRGPQEGALALSLPPLSQQFPNRALQSVGISGAVFDIEDAQVREHKMMHALSANT